MTDAPHPPTDLAPLQILFEVGEPTIEGDIAPEAITGVLLEYSKVFKQCYQSQLESSSTLAGSIEIHMLLGRHGSFQNPPEVLSSTLGSAQVEKCVLQRLARRSFPNAKNKDKATVTVTLTFGTK